MLLDDFIDECQQDVMLSTREPTPEAKRKCWDAGEGIFAVNPASLVFDCHNQPKDIDVSKYDHLYLIKPYGTMCKMVFSEKPIQLIKAEWKRETPQERDRAKYLAGYKDFRGASTMIDLPAISRELGIDFQKMGILISAQDN